MLAEILRFPRPLDDYDTRVALAKRNERQLLAELGAAAVRRKNAKITQDELDGYAIRYAVALEALTTLGEEGVRRGVLAKPTDLLPH